MGRAEVRDSMAIQLQRVGHKNMELNQWAVGYLSRPTVSARDEMVAAIISCQAELSKLQETVKASAEILETPDTSEKGKEV